MYAKLYTYGYEGLTIDSFISRLRMTSVRTVLDVRATPLSRKRGFSKAAFAAALHAAGIVYAHVPAMGCPKSVRDRYKVDGDWSAYTVGFLEYLNSQSGPVAELARIAETTTCCLVCFEADFNRCHRSYVARAVATAGGVRVVHLTAQGSVADLARRSAAA